MLRIVLYYSFLDTDKQLFLTEEVFINIKFKYFRCSNFVIPSIHCNGIIPLFIIVLSLNLYFALFLWISFYRTSIFLFIT